MKIEDLQKVIGTPEENRSIIVKALLLDLRLKCSDCGMEYITGDDMTKLIIDSYSYDTDPSKLLCQFSCDCGHLGEYTFKPNPFIPRKLSRLAANVMALRRTVNAKASGQTYKEYLSDKESSSDNYALEA